MKHLTGLQQYAVVTANYWAFTLTDGALRGDIPSLYRSFRPRSAACP